MNEIRQNHHMKAAQPNRKLILWLAAIVLLFLFGVILVQTGHWTRSSELDHINTKAGDSLNVYTGDLQIELDKFEALPYILSKNPLFLQLLVELHDTKKLDSVNRELERVNTLAETSAIYILDKTGHALATSNWNEKVSFIGEDLSFRPYFQQAIQGNPGRYFALGNTSHVRGYYFSAPMFNGPEIIGVLTVKVHLQRLEENWAKGSEKVVVTDPHGVIFISSYRPWQFRALVPLTTEAVQTLRNSMRYGDIYPDSIGTGQLSSDKNGLHFISLKTDAAPLVDGKTSSRTDRRYLIHSHNMPDAGWTVHVLSDISHVDGQVRNIVLLVAFLLVILFLSAALFYNKRRARLKQNEFEAHSRRALQEMNEQLEQRVHERTRELTLTNIHLTREVTERSRTENELRAAQEELIQAGKLAAIGQMATSITHEISQPLAAIRMFAENSLILLDEQRQEQVRMNLNDIADLVIKMSRITSHLKSFARKSRATLEPVDLEMAVGNVMVLLSMEMRKTGTVCHCTVAKETYVLADQVRLEQVLMNIFSNALDAVTNQPEKLIFISSEKHGDEVKLIVRDSGPGIAEEHIENIFEPFFTRKQQGKGLGLGLSLSRSIIKDFGGRITAENHAEQGAVFKFILKSCHLEEGAHK
ncbi:MAG TPA: sensor histidine kinase [Desulfobacterales bacterium]|nr:sensor histidine kinase [Desulfobacterales bacterium]